MNDSGAFERWRAEMLDAIRHEIVVQHRNKTAFQRSAKSKQSFDESIKRSEQKLLNVINKCPSNL